MDTVTILRALWRRRLFVAIVAIVALLAGVMVKYQLPSLQSRSYEVGISSAHILVDTPSSQVVNVSPRGSDTTAARADLLASLMVDGVVKATIAQQAGLKPAQLIATTSASTDPTPGAASGSNLPGPRAYVLTTQVLTNSSGDELPIIEVDTQAPNRAGAAKLAAAAVSGLGQYLNSKAALERIPDADRLQVNGLGVPQSSTADRGPSGSLALIVFVLVFVIGCGAILGITALIRGWRAASAREELGEAGPPPGGGRLTPEPTFASETSDPLVALDARLAPEDVVAPDPVLASDDRFDSDVVLMPDDPSPSEPKPRRSRRTSGAAGKRAASNSKPALPQANPSPSTGNRAVRQAKPAPPRPTSGSDRPARGYTVPANPGTLRPDSAHARQSMDAHAQQEAAYLRALRADG
jgi:hypothetical protein